MNTAIGYILVLVLTNGLSVSGVAPNKDPYTTYDECKAAGEFSKRQAPKQLSTFLCTPVFGQFSWTKPQVAPNP